MKRLALILAALGLMLLLSPSASACINDRETERGEKEFKSSYSDQLSTPPIATPEPSGMTDLLRRYGLAGFGGLLVLGAVVVTVRTLRRPSTGV